MDTRSDQPQKLKREYDPNFRVTQEYRDSLPDVQNSGSSDMQGANVPILQVGISGFRLPLRFVGPDGENLTLESKVTGTVSLDADKKGINMSRIIRIFYEYENEVFSPETLERVLRHYKDKLDSREALLKVDFFLSHGTEKSAQWIGGLPVLQLQFRGINRSCGPCP